MATTLTLHNQEFVPKAWETVPCPLCGSRREREFERYGYQHRYTYRQCLECGLAYQSPRPVYDADFVETAYEVYGSSNDAYWRDGRPTPQGEIVVREATHVLTELERHLGRKGRLLEIGCNTGFFLKVARDLGWSVVGVEISHSMAAIARRDFGLEAHAGDWTQIDLGVENDGRFDAVFCSHVIEHVPDPAAWMRRFREVLTPDGVLCLAVPNMRSLDRRFKRACKRLGLRRDRWEPWRTPDHLYEPCEKSLRPFFARAGFRVLDTYTYPSEWFGDEPLRHRIYHRWFRWGAKQRFFLRAQ